MSKELPETLHDFSTGDLCARDSRALRAVSIQAGSRPAFSIGPHSFVVVDVESSPEEVFEVSMDDHGAGKRVYSLLF